MTNPVPMVDAVTHNTSAFLLVSTDGYKHVDWAPGHLHEEGLRYTDLMNDFFFRAKQELHNTIEFYKTVA